MIDKIRCGQESFAEDSAGSTTSPDYAGLLARTDFSGSCIPGRVCGGVSDRQELVAVLRALLAENARHLAANKARANLLDNDLENTPMDDYVDSAEKTIAELRAQVAALEKDAAQQVAWLIESTITSPRTMWWNGTPQGSGISFTSDPNDTIRFCRKQDAGRVAQHMGCVKVTEHIWLDAAITRITP